MAKSEGSKTILIIAGVILGILLIGGIIVGVGGYWLYRIGTTVSPTPQVTKSQSSWISYPNSRYGFSLKYPQTFTKQESQNGDGITLTLSSPAITLRAYGSPNSSNETINEYLNAVRDDLFKGSEGAEEIAANETTLAGITAQERKWQYINPIDGSQTVMDQVTALKNDNFYTVQMVIGYSAYSEYAPMFDEIIKSFSIK